MNKFAHVVNLYPLEKTWIYTKTLQTPSTLEDVNFTSITYHNVGALISAYIKYKSLSTLDAVSYKLM